MRFVPSFYFTKIYYLWQFYIFCWNNILERNKFNHFKHLFLLLRFKNLWQTSLFLLLNQLLWADCDEELKKKPHNWKELPKLKMFSKLITPFNNYHNGEYSMLHVHSMDQRYWFFRIYTFILCSSQISHSYHVHLSNPKKISIKATYTILFHILKIRHVYWRHIPTKRKLDIDC